jgi:hypothetical protein
MSKLRLAIDIILLVMLILGISTNVNNGDIPLWAAIIIVILIVK